MKPMDNDAKLQGEAEGTDVLETCSLSRVVYSMIFGPQSCLCLSALEMATTMVPAFLQKFAAVSQDA